MEQIDFKQEGQTLAELDKAKGQGGAGATDDKKKEADNDGGDGAAGAGDQKPKPFNEDPEVQNYIARQVESSIAKEREQHKKDLDALREEIAGGRKVDVTANTPPRWFGGKQDQWNEFKEWVGGLINQGGEGVLTKITQTKQQEDQAVQEATTFLQSEISNIQTDKTLNPKGLKVDPQELLKVVFENELIDTKGRWNYRAGWRILRPQLEAAAGGGAGTKVDADRKKLAETSTKNDKGADPGAKTFKTSEDFKKKRPW